MDANTYYYPLYTVTIGCMHIANFQNKHKSRFTMSMMVLNTVTQGDWHAVWSSFRYVGSCRTIRHGELVVFKEQHVDLGRTELDYFKQLAVVGTDCLGFRLLVCPTWKRKIQMSCHLSLSLLSLRPSSLYLSQFLLQNGKVV